MKVKTRRDVAEKDNLMMDIILPGVFMTILTGCIAQLGFVALQSQAPQAQAVQYAYAISAFAN